MHRLFVLAISLLAFLLFSIDAQAEPRPRARDLDVTPGIFPPGKLNAITDVPGVRVGQLTLIADDRVRTGVTAILPHDGNLRESTKEVALNVRQGAASWRFFWELTDSQTRLRTVGG